MTKPRSTSTAHPDIMIVGAQKAATSSLATYLRSHPDVVGNAGPELTYYSDPREYARGAVWLASHYFPRCPPGGCSHVHLGKNVDVLPDVEAHRRAVADNPALQVVCVLRDPVARAYSAFQWARARGIEPSTTFREAIERHGTTTIDGRPSHGSYLGNGDYHSQLVALEGTFPREQIHVLFYDDITRNEAWIPALLDALGLSDAPLSVDRVVNTTRPARSKTLARVLTRRGPLRSAVAERLPADVRIAILRSLWKVNARSAPPPPIPPEDRSRLVRYFEPMDEALSQYLNRSLPWRVHAAPPLAADPGPAAGHAPG